MASLLTLLQSQPIRTLAPGEALIVAGEPDDGELYVLESGRLVVASEGIDIATIDTPGALIGEMSVLLGTVSSATVRAEAPTTVRVIENAIAFLERTPVVALQVATLACARLEATNRLVVQFAREAEGRARDQGMIGRLFHALTAPAGR